MTREERQVRAWIRTVLRHAAIGWVREHTPPDGIVWVPLEEGEDVWDPEDTESAARLWYLDCLPRLTPRDRWVLQALAQGWRPGELANKAHCHVRTIRRSIYRIRRQCPFW